MYLVYLITVNTTNNWLQFSLQRHVSTHTSHHQVMFRTFERTFIELPSTQQTIGYNLVYNDMFRLPRVIIRLCSEPLNVLNNYVHFGIPKAYTVHTINI